MGELNTMSINFLDPEKCKFYLNPNGFAALKTEDKDYRRVRLLRTLPLHRPFEYISVSDMDKNELGIIKNAADFPSESREIIEKDLAARYYCPEISQIYSIEEKMGSFYFDVSIDGFKKTFGVELKVQLATAAEEKIMTTRQTGGLHKGYKPIMPTRVSRRGLSLCSSLRVFATLATPKGVS